MCKWIKDILFPTNCFGKKKKCAKYQLPDGFTSVTLNIQWEGERLDVTFTYGVQIKLPPSERRRYYTNERFNFVDGDGGVDTIYIDRYNTAQNAKWVEEQMIYFNCTNVTQLIVNGEQLI